MLSYIRDPFPLELDECPPGQGTDQSIQTGGGAVKDILLI